MRVTEPLLDLAEVLMADPRAQFWGYDLSRRAHIRSGVMYPLLHRMLDEGWLEDGWEEPAAGRRKAPARRFYTLTDLGAAKLGAALAARPLTDRANQSWKPRVV